MANPASAGKMALIRSERCVRVRLHCQLDVTWKMAFCINSWHNDITVLHLIFTEWFRFSPLFSLLNDFSHLSSHVNSLDRQTVCFCEHNLRFTELTAPGGACVLPFNELWRWWHFGTTAAATAPTVSTITTFNVCWTGPLPEPIQVMSGATKENLWELLQKNFLGIYAVLDTQTTALMHWRLMKVGFGSRELMTAVHICQSFMVVLVLLLLLL